MTQKQPICPSFGNGAVVSVGTTSTAITLKAKSQQLCLTNQGANYIYVSCATTARAATNADMAIPPNSQKVITKDYDTLAITAIAETGATNLHVMPGEGFGT